MVLGLIESMTMVTIVTTKIEERGEVVSCPLVSRFSFVSWSGVGSQFSILDHQGRGFSQPSIVRYVVMSPTSYVMLYMLSKPDALACFECLGSGPSIAQKMRVGCPVHPLLSHVRVGKYP